MRIRFDSFEVDATSGELRKNGIRLRLQPQPFRVLLLLIEASGQVVTREEIRDCLWKGSTFVDFEHGINFSINQIRGALSDHAEHPRYVETLPRRGYRFIGTVERTHLPIHGSAPEILSPEILSPEILAPQAQAPDIPALPCEAKPVVATAYWRCWTVIASLAVLAAAIAGTYFFRFVSRRQHVLTSQDTIVLADFTNTTGDPAFDGTLRSWLAVQLRQSPFLSVLSDERIQQTLPLMGQPPDTRLTPQVAREICMRTGSTAVVDGSIARLGDHYAVSLDAVNCQSGDSLAGEEVEVARKEDVLKALGAATTKLRTKLGESLSTVEKFSTPSQVTTPSLEALQVFDLGCENMGAGRLPDAIPFFQRAIRLDPQFASAYGHLSDAYGNLGEMGLAAQYIQKAYELRGSLSEPEKLDIETSYYSYVTGDLEKLRQTLELWAQLYPRDAPDPPLALAWVYDFLGQYDKGLEEARESLRLDPFHALNYNGLAYSFVILNRLEEARDTIHQGEKAALFGEDSPPLHFDLYQLAFLENNAAARSQQVAWAAGKPGVEDVLLGQEADTAAYHGRLADARSFSRRAVASAERAQLKETSGNHAADIALIEALLGNKVEAREEANLALRHSTGRDLQYGAALALALTNDSTKAQSLVNDLARRFPADTIVQFNYLPALRAQIALNRKNPAHAIEALQVAVPYDLAIPPTAGALQLSLYPVYVRGNAFLAARRDADAAAEFKKILDHPGVVTNELIGTLAHLGLARAYAANGEIARSRGAYQDFFALWKDADPGIPRLVEAKAEYSKLK
jgi:DNA-binding winged helix-turn-helix (wHTH) protein/Flp pilus assembly protein TadD